MHLVAASLLLASPLVAADYHLTFDDEFNRFNSSRWQTTDFFGMRNNGGDYQAQWFADPTFVPQGSIQKPYSAFSSTNGILTIRAQPTPANTYSGATANSRAQPYVSGQITTAHKFTQRYGYYELRAKLPPGKGLWSRFWLLTDDGDWPGEYDICEVLGKDKPGKVRQTTHYKDANKPHGIDGCAYAGIVPTDGQFHIYGFLWGPKSVTWYVDGVATLKQINRINIPMYILLDLAVGNDPGNTFPGNPDDTTPWPANMEMDYIRVYSNDPSLPSVTPDAGYKPSVLPEGNQVVTTPTTAKLPDGWTSGDIGSPDVNGSSTWNPITGEWMVKQQFPLAQESPEK
jgi:beta-glucanase (GH16 family)